MADDLEFLLGRVALQDQAAFRDLYDRTSAKLFGVCLRLLRQRSEAEDVLQEAYVKVWRNAAQFSASGHNAMSWLIAVTRNHAIDRLRSRKADAAPLDDAVEVADETLGPEQLALAADAAKKLQGCLGELEAARAQAVASAYIEGYTYRELADRHGIPLNTVRTWLRRSLAKLRECLNR
jgi:RNA polymerase sigma-70 factor (ECF subfamily)